MEIFKFYPITAQYLYINAHYLATCLHTYLRTYLPTDKRTIYIRAYLFT